MSALTVKRNASFIAAAAGVALFIMGAVIASSFLPYLIAKQ